MFGGVAVHCCGECERHLPALAEIPNLRLLDFHYPHTRPEVVQEVLGDGKCVFSMNLSPRGSHLFPGKYDFLKYQQSCYEKGMRLVIFLSGNNRNALMESINLLGLGKTWDFNLEELSQPDI